jgi:hypothetical protein
VCEGKRDTEGHGEVNICIFGTHMTVGISAKKLEKHNFIKRIKKNNNNTGKRV